MIATAQRLMALVTHSFNEAVDAVAQRCARDGRIDPAAADAQQANCYALAFVHAELSAAGEALAAAPDLARVDRGLALSFVVEALVGALDRLDGVGIALDLDPSPLAAVRAGADLRALRRQVAHPDVLAELGAAVIADVTAIGAVPMDDMTAMAADSFARLARDVVAPMAAQIHRDDLTIPDTLLQSMRDMGVFGLSVPAEYGGSGGDADNSPMMIAVTEALSQASLAAAGSLMTRPEILTRALLAGGTEGQKRSWLPRIASGETLCAISITEPDYGSDVASLSLRGTQTAGGWLLNGAKSWCTFAGKANVLMVVTRTDPDRALGHRGLSLLLVEKPSFDGHAFDVTQAGGGRLSGRATRTIGYRGMHSFDLNFEDYFVPDSHVIGEKPGLGRGFYLTMAGMTGGRIQTAGRALGVMRACLVAAAHYAQDRRVFGAPLASYPLTQVKLAQMAARYVACRHLAFAVGRRLDAGGDGGEASLAKLLACRCAEWVAREALQIHGGMGYAEESAVSRYWIDARVLSIFEGAEETLALKVIARGLLDRALVAARHAA